MLRGGHLLEHVLAGRHIAHCVVLGARAVIHVVAKDTGKEHVERPFLIGERVVPSQSQIRLGASHNGTVLLLWRVGGLSRALARLLVVLIEERLAVLVEAGKLPGIERTERMAFHDALYAVGRRESGDTWIGLVDIFYRELRIGQLLHIVLIVREVDHGLPLEVVGLYRHGVNGKFNTLVAYLSHIGRHGSIGIPVGRDGIVVDKVAGALVVVFNGTA